MKHNTQRKQLGLIAVLFVFVMACMCSPTGLPSTPTPSVSIPKITTSPTATALPASDTPTVAPPASDTPTAIPASNTPTVEDTATPTTESGSGVAGLLPDAPWLIVSTSDGLWAANMDGSNLVSLLEKSYFQIDLHRAISPATHQIAVLTAGQDPFHGLALHIISLPDGKLHKVTDLTTPDTEPGPDDMPGDPIFEAMRAAVEMPSYAWSPDGKKLAFVGSLDGPQAEVYVYDIETEQIQKISDDEGQGFSPSWSPDGKSVLYFETESFGTGAGMTMKGIWVAAADGSGSTLLDSPESAGEEMIGWRDAQTAVVASWNPGSGTEMLRMYNLYSHDQTVLEQGPVYGAAVATGLSDDAGAILYANDDGLYLLPVGSTQPEKLSDEQAGPSFSERPSIRWQEGRIFAVELEGGNLVTFLADGSNRQDAPFNPSAGGALEVSSFGMIWGWSNKGSESEGAWISGPGLQSAQILSGPATAPAWNIDNDLLFFVDHDLYITTFDSFYTDAAPISSLSGDVLEAAWLGFDEALDKKYGP